MESGKLIAACILASVVVSVLASFLAFNYIPKSNEQMYKEFYATESLVDVSPSDYVDDLKAGKDVGILVDLRSKSEYAAGHLVSAISIPAIEMSTKQLLAAFSELPKGKTAITYCYSGYCMLSREVGKALSENGIYAKHFTAGWYEIQRDFPQYVVNGTQPGSLNVSANLTGGVCIPGQGDFRC